MPALRLAQCTFSGSKGLNRLFLGGDIINTLFYRNKSSVISLKNLFLELCKVVMSSGD